MKKTAKAIFTAFSSAMAALYFIICYYSVKMPDNGIMRVEKVSK